MKLASGADCRFAVPRDSTKGSPVIVSMWMARDVVTVAPDVHVAEAAALMARHHIRRLPVVEPRGKQVRLLGMVSASDILHAFPPDVNPFAVESSQLRESPATTGEIMRREVETTRPDTPIEEAAALMCAHKVGALPVLRDDALVGLITESDIFRALVSLFAVPDLGARITFDMSKGEDVFSLIAQLAKRRHMKVLSLISAEQHGLPVCVVRVAGTNADRFLEDIWSSGHLVLNVLRFPIKREE
jgi:acetoin utilization protein AcuB